MVENARERTIAAERPWGLGWWARGREFVARVREEMNRVTWPSRKEVYATTFVVILTSIFFGIYLWGLDLVFNRIIGWIVRELGA